MTARSHDQGGWGGPVTALPVGRPDSAERAPGWADQAAVGGQEGVRTPASTCKAPVQPDCAPKSLPSHLCKALSWFRKSSFPLCPILVSLGGPGGGAGAPGCLRLPLAAPPPRCLGNPTPKAGDLQKPGLGAQPALPSWAQPGFGPAHHSSGVLSPHPSSYGIRNCSRLGSGGLPTLRGTAPLMALCSGLGHTCSTPRSPAGPLGKSGPGNASLKELAGWGRFSGTRGGPGPGAAPGRDLLTVGSGESC